MSQNPSILDEAALGRIVLDSAFKVHTVLGPGLLESVYEPAMAIELARRGLRVERQKPVPVTYDGELLDAAFRVDLLVEDRVLIESKSVETLTPLFKKVTTNLVRLLPVKLGFLINLSEAQLKSGIIRIVNGLEGKPFLRRAETAVDLRRSSRPSRPSRDS